MATGPLERLVRRDRAIVLGALVIVVALAWAYLLWLGANGMAPAAMAGMEMGDAGAGAAPWSAADFLFLLAMWTVMMIGMMTPSVAPMLLIYAGVARRARQQGQAFAPTGWFAAGYGLAWTGFALVATALQWLLGQGALLTPMMAVGESWLAAVLLIAAGIYQWTPLKDSCLGQCRSPFQFIQAHGGFRRERHRSMLLGLKHGLWCIGCCWALMLLLFVGGAMNLLWIAALTILVLAEKLVPNGRLLSRVAGAALILAGALVLVRSL